MMGIEEGIAVKQTFEIIIISRDNHTWQGTLKTDRGEVSFQSEFQLLLELEPADGRRGENGAFARLGECQGDMTGHTDPVMLPAERNGGGYRMKRRTRRLSAMLLAAALMLAQVMPALAVEAGVSGQAVASGQVETSGQAGAACEIHPSHTDSCYKQVTDCVHDHTEDCYPLTLPDASPSDAREPSACTHSCSVETGCVTEELNCPHIHDDGCSADGTVSDGTVSDGTAADGVAPDDPVPDGSIATAADAIPGRLCSHRFHTEPSERRAADRGGKPLIRGRRAAAGRGV